MAHVARGVAVDDSSPRILIGLPARGSSVLGLPVTRVAVAAALLVVGMAVSWTLGRYWPIGVVTEGAALVAVRLSGWHPLAGALVVCARWRRRAGGLVEEQGVLEARGRGSAVLLALQSPIAGVALPGRAADLARLLEEAASQARPEDLVVISSVIGPELAFVDPEALSGVTRSLASHAYRVNTGMIVASRRGGRRARAHLRRVALGLEATSEGLEAIRLRHASSPRRQLVSSLGRMIDPCLVLEGGLVESATAIAGPGFAARAFVVSSWPKQAIDPGLLGAVLAPIPPARLVALVLGPVAERQALARIGRHRTELAADRLLRRERGFLLGSKDAFVEEAAAQLEEELQGGRRLCRYQLVLVVLAPKERLLERAEQALEVQAARARLALRRADGHHRELLEVALAGVRGWS